MGQSLDYRKKCGLMKFFRYSEKALFEATLILKEYVPKGARVKKNKSQTKYSTLCKRPQLSITEGIRQMVMRKGDVVIFHSNMLHRSDANRSDRRRLALAAAYNTKRNNPTKVHHHPCYKKMEKVQGMHTRLISAC